MKKLFQITLLIFLILITPVFSPLPNVPEYKVICDVNVLNQSGSEIINDFPEPRILNLSYAEIVRCAGCYGYIASDVCIDKNRYLDDIFPEKTIILMETGLNYSNEFQINRTYRVSGEIDVVNKSSLLNYKILNDNRDLLTIANEKYEFIPEKMLTGSSAKVLIGLIVIGGLVFLFIIFLFIFISLSKGKKLKSKGGKDNERRKP